jgi:hypothetical protein
MRIQNIESKNYKINEIIVKTKAKLFKDWEIGDVFIVQFNSSYYRSKELKIINLTKNTHVFKSLAQFENIIQCFNIILAEEY